MKVIRQFILPDLLFCQCVFPSLYRQSQQEISYLTDLPSPGILP